MFSARVWRKFFMISLFSAPGPMVFCNSLTMSDLSALLRVGALRIVGSLASFLKTSAREARALEVGSRLEDLAAAVYY